MDNYTVNRGRGWANSSFSASPAIGAVELSDANSAPGHTSLSTSSGITDFWLRHQHSDFTPNPRASVYGEIKRLAACKGWSYKTMMKRRNEALAAEISLHDHGKDHLEQWQQLCVEVGVTNLENVPKSIRACRKVSPLSHNDSSARQCSGSS